MTCQKLPSVELAPGRTWMGKGVYHPSGAQHPDIWKARLSLIGRQEAPDLCVLRKITGRGEIDPGISIPNLYSLSTKKAFMQE